MKKIILYIALFTASLSLSSCGNDWLDMPTDNSFPATKDLTFKDFQFMRVGLYDGIQAGYYNDTEYYAAKFLFNGDVRGDDFQTNGGGSRTGGSYQFKYSNADAGGSWVGAYWTITVANDLIKAKIIDYDLHKEEIEAIKGEAYFLRALCHFDLLRDYSDFWNLNSVYGVPIVDKQIDLNAQLGRNSVKEVYEFIVEDLTKNAIPRMSEKRHENGFADIWSAKALLCRVYLYMNEYEKCVDVAEEVMANTAGYKLWANSEYKDAWTKMNSSEALFEINNTSIDNFGRSGIGYLMEKQGPYGYGDMIATIQYTKLFDENDVRKTLFFGAEGDVPDVYLDKYPGVIKNAEGSDWDNVTQNFPVLRLSELYLNAAEAGIKSSNGAYVTKGNKYLTEIVQRANPNASAITDANIDRVLFERRLELGGEGWRVSDVLRNNKKMYRDNKDGYMVDINACVPAVSVNLTESDFEKNKALHPVVEGMYRMIDRNCPKIVLPIPHGETSVNKTIAKQQFPSWL